MSTPPRVLVLGGTGTTGSHLVARLRAAAVPVAVATRAPRSAQPDDVRFDWDDPASYAPAVRGVRRLYLIAPVGVAEPARPVEEFLRVAVRAGLRRAVLLSSSAVVAGSAGLGALVPLVRDLCPEWTVLRPSWFMQNFVGEYPLAVGIRQRGEIVTATGSGRVPFVDARDIAAVAARTLLDDRPHNTAHLITGPEALSYADAARVIAGILGRPVRHHPVDPGVLSAGLTDAGLDADYAALLAGMDADIGRGTQETVSSTVHDLTGRPATSFADFIAEHRGALVRQ